MLQNKAKRAQSKVTLSLLSQSTHFICNYLKEYTVIFALVLQKNGSWQKHTCSINGGVSLMAFTVASPCLYLGLLTENLGIPSAVIACGRELLLL